MTTLREKLGRRDPIPCEDLKHNLSPPVCPMEGFFFS